MRILGLAIRPPQTAEGSPAVTPELLASCLARYSRSNKGIDTILASIDWNNPDAAVDAIFKFVDYGHASIGGMTGGIAMVVDGCSMYLAYKLFEIAQYCDGQESSTRYIKLDASSLPDPATLGIPDRHCEKWQSFGELAFTCYQEMYDTLDRKAHENPSIVRVPEGASPKVIDRLRKNYALDRARYYIPFATKTNAAYVMSARAWAEAIKQLEALPLAEAKTCAAALRGELQKFAPRLARHAGADNASTAQAEHLFEYAVKDIGTNGVPNAKLADDVWISVENNFPPFMPPISPMENAFAGKQNRYSVTGSTARRVMVRAAWNNMAVAELRDLNRHRTGFRFSPLVPVGFYIPDEAKHPRHDELMALYASLVSDFASDSTASPSFVYGLLLGTQVRFEHSQHLDKFIYETELRTGMGAHFRYAEHLVQAGKLLVQKMPELAPHITFGSAEPE